MDKRLLCQQVLAYDWLEGLAVWSPFAHHLCSRLQVRGGSISGICFSTGPVNFGGDSDETRGVSRERGPFQKALSLARPDFGPLDILRAK